MTLTHGKEKDHDIIFMRILRPAIKPPPLRLKRSKYDLIFFDVLIRLFHCDKLLLMLPTLAVITRAAYKQVRFVY